MQLNLMLTVLLLIAVAGKANSVAAAIGILLTARVVGLDQKIPTDFLEKTTMFWGLVLITISVLAPFITGKLQPKQILSAGLSWLGLAAFMISLVTTWLSGRGLYFMTEGGRADLLPSLILGSVISAALLKGVPVGPLISSGILYVVARLVGM
ncbi:MAG: DUF441 domain-containing protein [Candidatus Fermentithermobacillus carboniphilus]|uniref:UPF0756 membrane protein IMF26_01900 n=1 Tax=Candidatus Fermentithermobacillus carboniphilus TaxID=3085328 RepID=A0AAT9LCG6_9FIRM|nr:MAG: DUF441 domain-containing protein [Candidatus Fermentithermobacillus carboniphilus]